MLNVDRFYDAKRSRSRVPQATVPGKRDRSSVARCLAILFFRFARRSTIIRLLIRIHSTPPQTPVSYVKLHLLTYSLGNNNRSG